MQGYSYRCGISQGEHLPPKHLPSWPKIKLFYYWNFILFKDKGNNFQGGVRIIKLSVANRPILKL